MTFQIVLLILALTGMIAASIRDWMCSEVVLSENVIFRAEFGIGFRFSGISYSIDLDILNK